MEALFSANFDRNYPILLQHLQRKGLQPRTERGLLARHPPSLIVAASVDWLYDLAMSNPESPAKRPLRRPLLAPDSLPELSSAIEGVDETVWVEVIRKMDEVYNDLLQYEVVLEQKNAALEDSQQFIESVLASMSDILIVCNRHGAIQEVNDSLCRFIGQDETVLRGQPLCNLFADTASQQRARDFFSPARPAPVQDCELLICGPDDLARVATQAAAAALARGTAVVAVGGDGSLGTVAQAAHAAGCPMGVIPYGTFNYFARTHGIPTEPAAAARQLLDARPRPVQVGAINDRVFLVNASLGVYPELLQDREAYKARFGRSRWVAFVAGCATLLRAQRRLRLHIETGSTVRDVQTLTLFVGNNRLQLQQFGAEPADTLAGTPGDGCLAALMLRPIGTLSMLGLMLHGAMGRLGEAAGVESFEFTHMVVKPRLAPGRREVVVAFDGEVARMRAPIEIRVLDKPLYLLQAPDPAGTPEAGP